MSDMSSIFDRGVARQQFEFGLCRERSNFNVVTGEEGNLLTDFIFPANGLHFLKRSRFGDAGVVGLFYDVNFFSIDLDGVAGQSDSKREFSIRVLLFIEDEHIFH